MKVNRQDLLNKLLQVDPGISNSESLQQSSCVVIRRGRFYTLNQEVACSLVSSLPPEWEGAIRAKKLIKLLQELPDDEIEVSLNDKVFEIKGGGRRKSKLVMEETVLLPVDEVERPKGWQKLDANFSEAVDLVYRCTKRKDDFAKACVHITPSHLEASDNVKMVRYTLPTFVQKGVLVRGTTLKVMAGLGMTNGCETPNWLHFYNPLGLRLSLCKHIAEKYPPLEQFLNIRGNVLFLPKGLADSAARAGIFGEDTITVKVSKGNLTLRGEDVDGEYEEEMEARVGGWEVNFRIPPKLLGELSRQAAECEVTECSVRVEGRNYVYCTSLEVDPK